MSDPIRSHPQQQQLEKTLATHLIGKPDAFGILDNDYDAFFKKRCRRLSRELQKYILPAKTDGVLAVSPASDTKDASIEDEEGVSEEPGPAD